MYEKRVLTRFPLKDVVCVLDQDQSGLQRQVTAQNGVLEMKSVVTPMGNDAKREETAVLESLQSKRPRIFYGAQNAFVYVFHLRDDRTGRKWAGD